MKRWRESRSRPTGSNPQGDRKTRQGDRNHQGDRKGSPLLYTGRTTVKGKIDSNSARGRQRIIPGPQK